MRKKGHRVPKGADPTSLRTPRCNNSTETYPDGHTLTGPGSMGCVAVNSTMKTKPKLYITILNSRAVDGFCMMYLDDQRHSSTGGHILGAISQGCLGQTLVRRDLAEGGDDCVSFGASVKPEAIRY